MDRAEYDRVREKIEQRYRRDLESLERVWAIVNEDAESPQAPQASPCLPLRRKLYV